MSIHIAEQIRPLQLFTILAAAWFTTLSSFADMKPNVLFIAIDDLNDWIGCLEGHPQVKTPNMDALAARGTLFTSAHCQSPLCNPSRTSLLLGLRPSTTGVYGLAPWYRDVPSLAEIVSLPRYFRQHGYRTYSAGKIYHGNHGRTPGLEFDEIRPPPSLAPFPPEKLVSTPSPNRLVDWGLFPHRDEDKGDWQVASWGVEQLHVKHDQPFFLAVGFSLPHVPCYATEKWFDLYPDETLQLPEVRLDDRKDTPRFSWYMHWRLPEPRLRFLKENDQWKNLVRSYLACTSFVDSQVGRVLTALEESPFAENTIVVLWSDHGFHLGEKLITGKNSLWDRSTRVPLIFAGPGITPHAVCNRPVELLDIYPTLVELCGLPPRQGLEGVSLVPQLKNASAKRDRPAITTHNPGNHGVRSEKWRYIIYADGSEELYNMQKDPNEWTNLANRSEYDSIKADLQRWLPKKSAPHAPGSRDRILKYENGEIEWEGTNIEPEEPVPEL
ncbi:sulfatase [Bythopirellula polymerisocia]|uniref:Choline-sulfatase n=1 Tax=Bythopirellula polymerisocia TaxID=2528003 RepID=A0A5C6D0K6_9BACT|nr:sulfatase [Bythopirellula polymerisocia]TWU30432.1 Choline-sulfatase [Bythopirellula polymerisocia]